MLRESVASHFARNIIHVAPSGIDVSDVDGFHEIYRVGTNFMKSDSYHRMTGSRPKRALLSFTNAKEHSTRRRLFSRPMSRKALLENWHDNVKEMTTLTVRKMHDFPVKEGKVDILDWWTFMAMDIVGRLMYGRSFGNIERGSVCPGVVRRSFKHHGLDC
jgi:cytochrome P450